MFGAVAVNRALIALCLGLFAVAVFQWMLLGFRADQLAACADLRRALRVEQGKATLLQVENDAARKAATLAAAPLVQRASQQLATPASHQDDCTAAHQRAAAWLQERRK